MSTIVLEKLEGDTTSVITDPCITVTEPTQFMLVGGGSATVTFNNVLVGNLSRSNPIYQANVAGEYCVSINGQCPYTAVCTDPIMGVGGGGGPPVTPNCCFQYESCAELNGEEIVVNVFELRSPALAIIAQRLELPDGTDVTATAILAACGTCCQVEACLTFQGFDYYANTEWGVGLTSTFEVLVDNVLVSTHVIDYLAADTGNKSSWYADLIAGISANTNWTMSTHTDFLSTDDGGRVIWNLEYSGPGGETLEIRYINGTQSHIMSIDSAGVMTNSIIDNGTALTDFGTPQFDQVPCNV